LRNCAPNYIKKYGRIWRGCASGVRFCQDLQHGPGLPLYFWGEEATTQRRAVPLLLNDRDALHRRLEFEKNMNGRRNRNAIEFLGLE
jgi:hypothetical protein